MVFDTSLLNTQHLVAIIEGAFGYPANRVANFTFNLPESRSPKVNVTTRLGFEVAYNQISIQLVIYSAINNPPFTKEHYD